MDSSPIVVSRLYERWAVTLLSAAGWFVLMAASQWFSPLVAPKVYGSLGKKKPNWNVRVVSLVHAILVCILSIPVLMDVNLQTDKVFGYSSHASYLYAVSTGYFLWDTIISIIYVADFGPSAIVHGVLCFFVFFFAQLPFLMYFGGVFLLFELSTPFLNIHWFMDKANMTGSRAQLVNGIVLVSAFFFVRICFGFYSSYQFFSSIFAVYERLPKALALFYALANIALNSLNVLWFRAMIRALHKRFVPSGAETISITKPAGSTSPTTTGKTRKAA